MAYNKIKPAQIILEREMVEEDVTTIVERTFEATPTWVVATVCFVLILISILIEQLLHLLELFFLFRLHR